MKIILITLFLLTGCVEKNNEKFAYHYDPPRIERNDDIPGQSIYRLKDLGLDNKVEVLFVIDNSGSMDSIQQNVINNARLFMDEFIVQRHIDWKLGIISTDKSESPFLGFDTSFSSKDIDYNSESSIQEAIGVFQDGVRALGTNGSPSEYVFYSANRAISTYNSPNNTKPDFIRSGSHLAVIMISDEEEQSEDDFGGAFEPLSFLNGLRSYVSANRNIRFYGALNLVDLDECEGSTWGERYEGSPYETIINATNGFIISACTSDFGTRLADISKDIASMVKAPGIPLRDRPKPFSIRVYYKGQELKPGAEADGGKWYFNAIKQTVNFYSFDFVDDFEKDYLEIKFEVDDGIPRDTDQTSRD